MLSWMHGKNFLKNIFHPFVQAARAIRGSGKKDAEMIPIIAITANAFAEDKRKTMEADMSVTEKRITEG